MTQDIDVYKRRYEREKGARQQAELLLETKSTELYHLNEALIALTSELEQKVLIRTEELQKARDHAIASNEAKSLFLANMSHEIRTPMNGILGVIYLLASSTLSEHQRHLLNTAKESGELLLAIINDILDVSKIEAGELTLEHISFNLIETVQSTTNSFLISAQQKKIALNCTIDPCIPTLIAGDPTRVRQVLYNLIGNAIKFTHQGSINVSATLCDDQHIEISVHDTGIGIAPEKIAHIFSPFAQADDSITRKFGGTGLGLAICSQLTKIMGKEIQATSVLGEGSTFTFWISIDAITQAPQPRTQQTSGSVPQFVENLIMLVDDNPVNREIGAEILRAQGLIVDCFENGQIALDYITRKDYRAVLMDIQMPVMDGLSATQKIRAIGERYSTLPIIAMTAHARKEDIEKSLNAGMNAHLTKPIEPQKIFSLLAKWIPINTDPSGFHTSKKVNSQLPNNQLNSTEQNDTLNADDFKQIDIKEALVRTDNNHKLLKKVLLMFLSSHQDDGKKLIDYFHSQQFPQLQALAHKLKGSSASISAKKVSFAANQLEKACKEKNYVQCESFISKTTLSLEQVFQELLQISIFERPVADSKKTPTNIDIKHKIEEFIKISQSDLITAEKILSDILSTEPENAVCNKITQHFDNFEIDEIYPLLKHFLPTDCCDESISH